VTRAAFLDRDGTLLRDVHYLRDPRDVEVLPGVPAALRRLGDAGFLLVVVTNQSGIARGLLGEADYEAVDARMDALLAAEGVTLAAAYHCPHHPEHPYRGVSACDCRKPGVGLYRRAVAELGIDAATSAFIGDRWRDVEPSLRLGSALGVLVPSPDTPPDDVARAGREAQVAADLAAAVSLVVGAGAR
jgi:D-glycero-D-manno-heptose 1,7-bisphosphate phosphatase